MYSFTNADGEPTMSGEAYRFEAALDADYQPDPYDADEDVADECEGCGWPGDECECNDVENDDFPMYMEYEDSGLDGSYEE